jgi:hypothetical protein
MRIVKILLIIVWIIVLLWFILGIISQNTIIRIQNKQIESIKKSIKIDDEGLIKEYYQNFTFISNNSECKTLADSILKNSSFLKIYDEIKRNKEMREK